MITKEQAQNNKYFLQTRSLDNNLLTKPNKWRANGKCKTWKRQPERFQLPIKHGLYDYAYITNDNAHLFIVE
jgi:hypothetical protein